MNKSLHDKSLANVSKQRQLACCVNVMSRLTDLFVWGKTTFVDSHCGQYSPAHPFLVTLLPSRFQVLFIMSEKYSSLSIDIETLL